MIIELRGKLDAYLSGETNDSLLEVRLALETFGYTAKDIQEALSSLSDNNKSTQHLIREALGYLQK